MLEPSDEFVNPLRAAGPRCPHNVWLVECALSTIERRAPAPQHEGIVALAARCRWLLNGVPRPVVPLRQEPSELEIAQMNRERDSISAVYASAGADAAFNAISGTLIGSYTQEYTVWARSQVGRGVSPNASRVSASDSEG